MALEIVFSEKRPGYHEVSLNGRLDTDTAPGLEKELEKRLAKQVMGVRFDMSALNYISSMGIRVILKTFKALRRKKASLLMANLQPQIKKVFEIAAALPPENIFASIQEADAYFDSIQKKALEEEDD